MKKTYVTTMPNHIGAFLQASRCFARLGVNITRVSYNKAVDSHTLFIDAEGTPEKLQAADEELSAIGYLPKSQHEPHVLLLSFLLKDEPGSVTRVLELIERFSFNISYISSQEDASGWQDFKMGLFVENSSDVSAFLEEAEKLCRVRVIDYNRSEKVFDNSIFYQSFVSSLAQAMGGGDELKQKLMVNANLAMQTLDEQGLSPYRTFDSISHFAELLSACRGEAFSPRVTRHLLTEKTSLTVIEPPCGSNTMILQSGDDVLFIDTGYACYQSEMLVLLHDLLPAFDRMKKTVLVTHADVDHCGHIRMKKTVLVTHADVDHCGLLPLFDEILLSRRSAECLQLEYNGEEGFREQNRLHKPYIQICKALTAYQPPHPDKLHPLWGSSDELTEPLRCVGSFAFADLNFEVYEGKGGHLRGEIVLIDYEHCIAFTGDVYVNTHGMTSEQKQYNRYAPILMTSVDTDPVVCAQERKAILQRLGAGKWQIFGAHGSKKDYEVTIS